jgi:hypothetical protein
MHHYGEDALSVDVTPNDFRIELRNQETGAILVLTGPRNGVFENPDRVLEYRDAEFLGRAVAHLLREATAETEMTAGA